MLGGTALEIISPGMDFFEWIADELIPNLNLPKVGATAQLEADGADAPRRAKWGRG